MCWRNPPRWDRRGRGLADAPSSIVRGDSFVCSRDRANGHGVQPAASAGTDYIMNDGPRVLRMPIAPQPVGRPTRAEAGLRLAKTFGRGFLIVGLQACSVVAVSAHNLPAAFISSGMISAVWWTNTQTANRADFKGARAAYCAGAAFGSALVAWLTAR